MKQVYALVNTASPGIGLITVGEVLTEKQMSVLGAEKIEDLILAGVLAPMKEQEKAAERPQRVKLNVIPEPTEPEPEEAQGEEDELPTLDAADELVSDEPAKAPPKKTGRRKTK